MHELLAAADEVGLDRPSDGTRWTNRQLLFHMMFGYMVVRALLPLVKMVSRLPVSVGRAFAAVLNAATLPFNSINYWGSVLGSCLYRDQRMGPKFDVVIAALERRLARESEAKHELLDGLPLPVGSLHQGRDDVGGRLSLPDTALRVPSATADSQGFAPNADGRVAAKPEVVEMSEHDAEIRTAVREYYVKAVQAAESCCGPTGAADDLIGRTLYGDDAADMLPEGALVVSLGCGNPTLLADLRPGQVVLDLGSGGGIDVLLSARRVAPSGKAYGLDMTPEMLEVAPPESGRSPGDQR